METNERRIWGANGADVVRTYPTTSPEGEPRIEVTADTNDQETTVTLDIEGARNLIRVLQQTIREATR
jgi:hypothetical protein